MHGMANLAMEGVPKGHLAANHMYLALDRTFVHGLTTLALAHDWHMGHSADQTYLETQTGLDRTFVHDLAPLAMDIDLAHGCHMGH